MTDPKTVRAWLYLYDRCACVNLVRRRESPDPTCPHDRHPVFDTLVGSGPVDVIPSEVPWGHRCDPDHATPCPTCAQQGQLF